MCKFADIVYHLWHNKVWLLKLSQQFLLVAIIK